MKKTLPLILSLFLAGCATGERVGSLQPGMSKQQVIASMGKPDGYSCTNGVETLRYTNKLLTGFSWDRADYYAVIDHGKLTTWGTGQVRQNQPVSSVFVAGAVVTPATY